MTLFELLSKPSTVALLLVIFSTGFYSQIAYAQTIIGNQNNNSFQTYEDPSGIKINYPNGWAKTENINQVTFYSKKENINDPYLESITLIVNDLEPNQLDLDGYIRDTDPEQILSSNSFNLTNIVPLQERSFTIKGYPVYRIEFNATQDNYEIRGAETIAMKSDKVYTVISLIEASKYYSYLPLFQKTLNSFIDVLSQSNPTETGGITLAGNPIDVAVNSNTNMIYIIYDKSPIVSVINGYTDKLVNHIEIPGRPTALAINLQNNTVYVNSEWPTNTVFVIDGTSNRIMSNITVGNGTYENLQSMSIDSGGILYLTDAENKSVYAIDTANVFEENENKEEIIKKIWISDGGSDNDGIITGVATNTNAHSGRAYVTHYISGELPGKLSFNGSLSVIDANEYTNDGQGDVISSIMTGRRPSDVTVNPYTDLIYVSDSSTGKIYIIDSISLRMSGSIRVERGIGQIALNPDTNKIYVTNDRTHSVTILDETTHEKIKNIRVGKPNIGEIADIFSEGAISVNPTTNIAYTTNDGTRKLYMINGSSNTLVTGINFTTTPSNGGDIYCDERKVSNRYVKYEVGNIIECNAIPRETFGFGSWSGNLERSTMQSNSSLLATLFDYLKYVLTGSNSDNEKIQFSVNQPGILQASFKVAPVPVVIAPEVLAGLYALAATIFTGWLIPNVARWLNSRKQGKIVHKHMKKIFEEWDKYRRDHNKDQCMKALFQIRREFSESYSAGTINDSQYNILSSKVSEYETTIKNENTPDKM